MSWIFSTRRAAAVSRPMGTSHKRPGNQSKPTQTNPNQSSPIPRHPPPDHGRKFHLHRSSYTGVHKPMTQHKKRPKVSAILINTPLLFLYCPGFSLLFLYRPERQRPEGIRDLLTYVMDFRRPPRSSWIDKKGGGKKHDTKGMERGNIPEKNGKRGEKEDMS